MRLPTFDRTDLTLTRALLCLGGVAVLFFSVALPVATWLSGGPLRRELVGLGPTGVPGRLTPQRGVSVKGADSIVVRIHDAGVGTWLAALLPGVLLSGAVCLAIVLVLRLLRSIEHGRPFVSASAKALRHLGVVILLGSVAFGLGDGLADAVVSHRALEGADLSFTLNLSGAALVGGLLAFALAEAFALGTRLQDDVEGLV